MKWRRLRTLISRGFKVVDEENVVAESGGVTRSKGSPEMADSVFDWSIMDKAIGRETPTHVTKVSLDEMQKMVR